jgi:phenylalanyl-tRNA synthetase beta chain
MKALVGWLRQHVDLPEPPREIARRLTAVGLVVECVEGEGDDAVLEVDVTSNRPDALSHVGLARELAAATGRGLRLPEAQPREDAEAASDVTSVAVSAPDLCPRYAARVVRDVKVGPSPAWMARRLEACGIRPINVVVDVTNHVLLELGHPLHAFDLDLLRGRRIVVRRARDGETMRTLDGVERRLWPEALLIADAEVGVAVAGVMGGADSEIRLQTRDVLIESALFAPASIRRTAARLGLHTEASHRFERGADREVVALAADRAAALIAELTGGRVLRGLIDVAAGPSPRPEVRLRQARLRLLGGLDVPRAEAVRILEGLGFAEVARDEAGSTFRVPSHRVDVSREVDLIEEVLRHVGYDRVPFTLPPFRTGARPRQAWEAGLERLRGALVGAGYHQHVSYSFGDPRQAEPWATSLGADVPGRTLTLTNPLSEALSVMRTSLLPGLLQAASVSARRGEPDVRLFEEGRIYLARPHGTKAESPAEERHVMALVAMGRRGPQHFAAKPPEVDLLGVKGAVLDALRAVMIGAGAEDGLDVAAGEAPRAAPGGSAEVRLGGRRVGWIARIHPDDLLPLEITSPLFAAEIDLSPVLARAGVERRFRPLSRFPRMVRDVSILVDRNRTHGDIIAAVEASPPEGMESIELVDRYLGKGVPAGQVSLTFSVSYRLQDRTLTQDEVDRWHESLLQLLVSRVSATLRGPEHEE